MLKVNHLSLIMLCSPVSRGEGTVRAWLSWLLLVAMPTGWEHHTRRCDIKLARGESGSQCVLTFTINVLITARAHTRTQACTHTIFNCTHIHAHKHMCCFNNQAAICVQEGSPVDLNALASLLSKCMICVQEGSPVDLNALASLLSKCMICVQEGSPVDLNALASLLSKCMICVQEGSPECPSQSAI